MSKLTQREDALASETMNQVRILKTRLKVSMKNSQKEIEKMIKDDTFIYTGDLKTSKKNERKIIRTKKKVSQ